VQVTHHPWINCNPQKHKGVLVVVSVAIHAWPALTFHECHSTQNNSTSARLGRQCPPCPTRKHVRSQGFPAPRRHPHLRPRCLTHQARQPRRRAPEAFQIPPSVWQGSLCRERYSTAMLRRGLRALIQAEIARTRRFDPHPLTSSPPTRDVSPKPSLHFQAHGNRNHLRFGRLRG